ncbi:DUF3159 domain-containing protein [Flaviflexus sp.]|uniref:DUF3159 domain-containing protein n=1 Tax=Flaviflexus sp. TaxID=1969482 RepID=UPI003F93015E
MSERDNPDNTVPDETPAKKTGIASVVAEDFSVWQAVGGVRGLAEAVLPSVLFVIVFLVTSEIVPAVGTAIAVVVICLAIRLIQRIDITPALGGAFGVAISGIWAWRSGEAENYFAMGLWTNGAYLAVFLISLLATWPLIGVAVALLRGEDQSWRTDPEQASRKRRYYTATWLWVGLFGLRLAVQLPLYLADDQVGALGIARIVMGPFLFAIVAWLTWMLCREPSEVLAPTAGRAEGEHREAGSDTRHVERGDRASERVEEAPRDPANHPDSSSAPNS